MTRRAVVPASRKAWLLARAMVGLFPARVSVDVPPLAATAFLVDAVAATSPRAAPVAAAAPSRRGVNDSVIWVIDLFERLERRDQMQRSASTP